MKANLNMNAFPFASLFLVCTIIGGILSGCIATPEKLDPLASLSTGQRAHYKDMNVALLVSENTRNTIDYLRKSSPRYDVNALFNGIGAILNRNFRSVVKIDKIEDAAAVKADVIVILDVYSNVATPSTMIFTHMVELKTIFLSMDRKEIERVQAKSEVSAWAHLTVEGGVEKVADQAQTGLETALLKSVKLTEFAKAKARLGETFAQASMLPALAAVRSDIDDLPVSKIKPNKKKYAIVIGIEQYRQHIPKADFASQDARLVADYLTRVLGYPDEQVVTLLNDRASNVDMVKYFEKWLPNNVDQDSMVFVYYSGHGAPNPKTSDAYLVPYDADPAFIDETGYSLKRMYAALGKLPAKEVIVALDSCFSGAGGRSVIAKGSRPLVMNFQANMVLPKNMKVLSASSGDQASSTYDEKGHGLFTYFMLKGIKNEDVVRKDGSLDIAGLYDYVKPQVSGIARKKYNNEQTPQLIEPKRN